MKLPTFGAAHFKTETYTKGNQRQTDLVAVLDVNLDSEYINNGAFVGDISVPLNSETADTMTKTLKEVGSSSDFYQDEAVFKTQMLKVFEEAGQDKKVVPQFRHRFFKGLYPDVRASYKEFAPLVKEKLTQKADEFWPSSSVKADNHEEEVSRFVQVRYKLKSEPITNSFLEGYTFGKLIN